MGGKKRVDHDKPNERVMKKPFSRRNQALGREIGGKRKGGPDKGGGGVKTGGAPKKKSPNKEGKEG